MIDDRVAARRTTFEKYSVSYETRSTNLTKSLIVLHSPVMALMLALIYFRRKIFFIDHMIFALYLMGFILLATIVGVLLIDVLGLVPFFTKGWLFKIYSYALLVGIVVYFYLAVRRFYREKIAWSLLKTPMVVLAFIASHFIYRSLLFFIVFWTT